ncbi:hypothetical protein UF75_4645 [Desulfosporosinus sp. I2]|nr:hypothetical protein UF75_4645 [Desulfosporosinus sp. I2]
MVFGHLPPSLAPVTPRPSRQLAIHGAALISNIPVRVMVFEN